MVPIFAIIDAPIIMVIGAVVVLLFGADRLPKLARAMGQAKKEFDGSLHSAPPVEPRPSPPAAAAQTATPVATSAAPPPDPAAPSDQYPQ
ncbi:MAG: twin-arginine translocase TatA/TatE family subunit [Candidatus Eremiobacteraeota bacterium]|nr:twin-arginine translocase TatA/TatE family subunit [Candidatus Eremiobacteraeota bacterium]